MNRSTLIVLAVFAVLLTAAVMLNDRPAQRGSESLSYADLDLEALSSLSFEGADGRLQLEKNDSGWVVAGGRLADPDKITRALEGLQTVDSSDVVSTSEERQAKYGVDSESGLTIEVRAGSKKVAHLVVGTSESGSTFARAVGDDTIFQLSRGVRHLFPVEEKQWIKLRLADGKLEDASRVELHLAGGQSYVLIPADENDEWALEDPSVLPSDFRFDGAGARSLASSAVNLRAKEIVAADDMPEDDGLAGEHDRIVVTTTEGVASMHLGATTEAGDIYARVDGRDDLFLLPSYQARNVIKTVTDLRDLRLLELEPAAAVALSIKTGKNHIALEKGDDGVWSAAEGSAPPEDFDFDPSTVDRLIQSLPNVRAKAVAEGVSSSAAGLDRPSTTVEVTMSEGDPVVLAFGVTTKDEDDRALVYAEGNADDHIYTLVEFQANRFTRGWDTFKRVEPPPQAAGGNPWGNLDPETLKNLPPEVRESIMKQMQQEQQKQQLMQQLQKQGGG